jgi:hypothetical protein
MIKMRIYWTFPAGWWVVLAIIYGIYFFAYFLRKRKTVELWPQIKFGLVTVAFAFLVEFTAISFGLWSYVPGNWPAILWFGYFSVGLAGYQIFKKLEEK